MSTGERHKLDNKTRNAFLLGIVHSVKLRVYNPVTEKVIVSCNVLFNENLC